MSAALTREERRLVGIPDITLQLWKVADANGKSDQDEQAPANPVVAEMANHGLSAAQQKLLWGSVSQTPNFWETLAEIEPGCVRSLAQLARKYRWETIFLTKRPRTAGDTAQVQTQRWLEHHGFGRPSVFVVNGSRGKIAEALDLDIVVDDLPVNCVDVLSDSRAKAILVWRGPSTTVPAGATRLGIRVVRSMGECLDVLAAIEGRAQRRTWKDRVKSALRPAALN
jgi:hypothetical protein